MIKRLLLTILILIVIALAVLYFARNILAEKAVEEGGTYALGVNTDLGSASVEIGGGSFEMNDYRVDNPEGYSSDYFLVLKRGMLDVDAGSVLDDQVTVDSLVIDGAMINLEIIDTKANFKELLDHLNKIDFGSSESEQKFLIKTLSIRDISVAGKLTLMGKEQFDKTVSVNDITLKNIGSETDGASIAEITSTVVKTLIKRATSSGTGLIPEGFNLDTSRIKEQIENKVEDEAKSQLQDLGSKLLKKDG